VDERSNYIDWVFNLEEILKNFNIECSDYDEFHVNDAIKETEKIIDEYDMSSDNNLTELMIDNYMNNAIKNEPSKKDYYETISTYVKKRLL
jgi:outer membrane protein assembly factor BamD (BamD/ComL family)